MHAPCHTVASYAVWSTTDSFGAGRIKVRASMLARGQRRGLRHLAHGGLQSDGYIRTQTACGLQRFQMTEKRRNGDDGSMWC